MLGQAITPAAQPRPATMAEQGAYDQLLNRFQSITVPKIQAAIASGEICAMVQAWGTSHGIAITTWTPTDQALCDTLISYSNRMLRVIDGLHAQKYFLNFEAGRLQAVASPTMPREEYQDDLFPSDQGFGVVPIIVWVIIGGITLIGSLWGASEIIEAEADRQKAKNQHAIIAADFAISKASKPAQAAWKDFKNQNQAQLMERAKAADNTDTGGVFGKLFGKTAAKGAGIAIGIGAALIGLMMFTRYAPAEKKKPLIVRNPCGGGKKIVRHGPPVKWSANAAKRGRQAEHIAAYYEGQTAADQLAYYREQAEGGGWNVSAVYSGPVDYDGIAQGLADNYGASAIEFDRVPF